MSLRSTRRGAACASTLAAAFGLVLAGAGAAHADPATYQYVVGVPSESAGGQGAIEVRQGSSPVDALVRQSLSENAVRLGHPQALDRFGAAVATQDLDGDGFDDVVVGVPGTPQGLATDPPGHVNVLFGSALGITVQKKYTLTSPARPGDEFGSALAIGGGYLWIGAPGHDVNGKADAGAVFRYKPGPGGSLSYVDTITQDDADVPGDAKAGDHFGAVLASAHDGVIVGVPDADVGAAADAGEIVHLHVAPHGALLPAEVSNQDSPGVPGVAESGDHFGAAVSRDAAVVGVPGEDVGSHRDAGAIQTYGIRVVSPRVISLTPNAEITQDSEGVPGTAETGDEFGAAVEAGIFTCRGFPYGAVGAPGEDVGTISDAGSVTLLELPAYGSRPGALPCTDEVLRQGDGLPGRAEAGDRVGATLGRRAGDPRFPQEYMDTLLVGSPGEDVQGELDTGRVYLDPGPRAKTVVPLHGDEGHLEFGSVLPQ